MALKENYKDDILDTSQNVKRKYQMENNGDGTVSFTDVTEYTQQGDSFGASDMNAVNSEVNEVVNNLGAKNMLPNNATTRTINGITFTVNNDGSVTVNGTASSVASLFLIGSTSAWGSNQYKNCILNGCPSGGSNDSYRIVMQTSSDGSAISKTYLEDGNGVLIDDDNQYCKIYIRIAGGYTANNLIFKPMIRPSRIKDDTYAPYAQTNKELTDNLSGFKFYPTGTGIVGLISDDSAYTDTDGNYVVWGTATANQLVEDNPNTYKSVPSEEDTRGKEGEDTAMSFGGGSKTSNPIRYGIYSKTTNGGSDSISQNTVPDSELVVISFVVGSGRYASSWTFGVNMNISGGSYEEVYSDSANQVTPDSTGACEVRGIYKVIRKEKGTQLSITGNITNIGNNKKCGAMLTITEF